MAKRAQSAIAGNRRGAFNVRLELLRNDHTSPSLTLAHQAIDLAEDWIAAGLDPKRLAVEFHSVDPRLALVANVARMIEEEDPRILESLQRLRESLCEGNRRIAARVAELCGPNPTILTLSNSGTVCDALVHIGPHAVYVVDARPGSESTLLAEQLRRRLTHSESEQPAEIHLIEAATIGNIVPRVDCAVVGADAISRTGAVLHKVGTLPLALCCRHFGKPLYALGHSLKQVDHEIDEPPPPHSVPETRVFDITPAQLVTAIVTERTESLRAARSGN